MRKLFILFLLILFSCNSSNKKNAENNIYSISENEIYEVINSLIVLHDEGSRKDGLKENPYKYILDKDIEPILTKHDSIAIFETDTLFTTDDKCYIKKQIAERKNFRFSSKYLKFKKVLSSDTIMKMIHQPENYNGNNFYERYYSKYGQNKFYTFGLPLFSLDRKTVFIKVDSFGHGHTLILKKVNDHWKYYCEITNWVS